MTVVGIGKQDFLIYESSFFITFVQRRPQFHICLRFDVAFPTLDGRMVTVG